MGKIHLIFFYKHKILQEKDFTRGEFYKRKTFIKNGFFTKIEINKNNCDLITLWSLYLKIEGYLSSYLI